MGAVLGASSGVCVTSAKFARLRSKCCCLHLNATSCALQAVYNVWVLEGALTPSIAEQNTGDSGVIPAPLFASTRVGDWLI